MSRIQLINGSSVTQKADAIVNAANRYLAAGGGVCGAIFSMAGMQELTAACSKIKTPLRDGEVAITPAFNITSARYIIHAVGPNFAVTPTAFKELYMAYYNSLLELKNNDLHSISFPLISSGIFGGDLPDPAGESTKQCIRAYKSFVKEYPDYDIDVKLCAFSPREMQSASSVFSLY